MKQCVILVGGKGSRLGEITKNFPKPMLDVNNKPFLLHLIEQIKYFGFKEVLLLAGHSANILDSYFDTKSFSDIKIKIIKEKIPLGTGGALINAYKHLDDNFFLMNGDSIIDGNWLSIIENFNNNYDVSMALVKENDCSRYGSVNLDKNTVISFTEKNKNSKKGFINGGVYCLNKKILSQYELKNLSFEQDILPTLVKNKRVAGSEIKGFFIDIGTPESLEFANESNWSKAKKAVVFDRDGTLNIDNGYTHKVQDLKWKPGAISLIKYLNDLNFLVFVATNQAGIAKGIFKENDMHLFHCEMQKQLRKKGAHIDEFYYCPYHIDGCIDEYKIDSNNRKPKTGMLDKIFQKWNLKKENMLMVGDRDSDIQCANNFDIYSIKYNGLDNLLNLKDNINKKLLE